MIPKPVRMIRHLALVGLIMSSGLSAAPVPDFSLVDKNSTSPRSGSLVSPRDYRQQISAYYFGSAG